VRLSAKNNIGVASISLLKPPSGTIDLKTTFTFTTVLKQEIPCKLASSTPGIYTIVDSNVKIISNETIKLLTGVSN
jgi:hypothetical protein